MAKIPRTLQYIEVETCSACTRNCNWCLYGHYKDFKERGNQILENHYIEQVFNDLAGNGYKGTIGLFSMNEPLLDERITNGSLLELGRSIFENQVSFHLTTNGDLLTDDILKTLFSSGLSRLIISCYDDQMLERGSYFTKNNFDVVILDKRYFQTGSWEYNRAGSVDCNNDNHLNYQSCYLPMFQSVIGWDGEVRLCCHDALGTMKIGNIKENSLFEILTNNSFDELRKSIRNNRTSIEPCKSCNYGGRIEDILEPFPTYEANL